MRTLCRMKEQLCCIEAGREAFVSTVDTLLIPVHREGRFSVHLQQNESNLNQDDIDLKMRKGKVRVKKG
jgi:hypothetical protein